MRAAPRPRLPRDHVLTQRQRRICTLIAGGTSHGEVARALGVSDKTIARHVHDAYAALGVSSVDGLRAVLGGSEAATFGKGRGAASAPFDATSRA
ncbi:MAG: helix-turn-helix transcriptional regulator [Deltaproteobacteria bacterium]|nr:helix-turn-helix transcriptional regulator [Deltaproteobacteria bacterium]